MSLFYWILIVTDSVLGALIALVIGAIVFVAVDGRSRKIRPVAWKTDVFESPNHDGKRNLL